MAYISMFQYGVKRGIKLKINCQSARCKFSALPPICLCFIQVPVFFFNAQPVGFDFGYDIGNRVLNLDFFAAEQGDDCAGCRFNLKNQIDIQ